MSDGVENEPELDLVHCSVREPQGPADVVWEPETSSLLFSPES